MLTTFHFSLPEKSKVRIYFTPLRPECNKNTIDIG